jgi:hypothetical protein
MASMDLLENTLFYKPTGSVQIANKFSLVERKLLNAVIWHSQKHKFKPGEHALPVRDVFHLIGLDSSRNNEVLKDAIRTLTGTIIEWNIFGADRVEEWGVCTFLASGVIRGGKLYYILNPKIVEKINQPTLYAKIQLLVQSQVRKRHALVLYEFFLDSLSRTRRDSLRIVLRTEKLYELLAVNKDMSYKFFNRDVIKPSVNEITKHTDITTVTTDTNREGRKVVELIFLVQKKEKFQLYLDFDTERLDHVERLEDARSTSGNMKVQALLQHHGVGERRARTLVKTFEEDRIRGNIEYLLEQQKSGKQIQNVAAYLVKAIEEDYRRKKSPKELKEERAEKRKAKTAAVKKERDKIQDEWKRFCEQRVKEHFAEKPEGWQKEKRNLFLQKIEEEARGSIQRSSFRKQGFDSPMIQAMFFSGLREELLTLPEEMDFEKYLEFRASGVENS